MPATLRKPEHLVDDPRAADVGFGRVPGHRNVVLAGALTALAAGMDVHVN